MASNFESSIQKGSDLFFDFPCYTCQENDRNTEAGFYCTQCSKFYCCKCVEHHNNLYKKHSTLGKDKINIWPEATVDLKEQCQEHKGEKLTAFCEDHDQLLCHVCHVYKHKSCSRVVLLTDKVKALRQDGKFNQLTAMLDTLHGQLIQKNNDFEESIQSLDISHKQVLEEINTSYKKIIDHLNHLKGETIKELDTMYATFKLAIQMNITPCNASAHTMKGIKVDWQKINGKSEIHHFITYMKCLDHSIKAQSFLQETVPHKDITLTFQPDTAVDQALSTMSLLGNVDVKLQTGRSITTDATPTQAELKAHKHSPRSSIQPDMTHPTSFVNNPDQMFYSVSISSKKPGPGNKQGNVNQSGPVSSASSLPDHRKEGGSVNKPNLVSDPNKVIRMKSKTEYSVTVRDNIYTCKISGICETAAGDLLLLDRNNSKVILLDQTYKVVSICNLPAGPQCMCSIDSSLVAVTLNNSEVHFIRGTNWQLVKLDRTLELQHECSGIAHHQGSLYITSGTALYNYTVDGTEVRKMYESTSNECPGLSCAVSPDGDRIYVADNDQLVTLSRDGTVISKLTDPALNRRFHLHVTDSGQVLVCIGGSHKILQVDTDGRKILAAVVTQKDGIDKPMSVCYSKHRGTLIVGMYHDNYIMVIMIE